MKILKKDETIVQKLVGEVQDSKDEVESICVTMHSAPVVNFADGKAVVFSWAELVDMAVNFKNMNDKDIKLFMIKHKILNNCEVSVDTEFGHKEVFTQKEIDKMIERGYIDLDNYYLIEVEK